MTIEQENGLENRDFDTLIGLALEHERKLLKEFFDLGGNLNEESEDWEYWTVREANAGKDREQALRKLNEFLTFMEDKTSILRSPNPFSI